MFKFNYNSYHKIITGIILLAWAIFHFTGDNKESNQYHNGQIKKTGGRSNGKNHGLWTWHYANGQKKMEGYFEYGKRTGTWTTWDKNGHKLTQGTYENDQLNGTFIRWNAQKEIEEQLLYKNDRLIRKLPMKN